MSQPLSTDFIRPIQKHHKLYLRSKKIKQVWVAMKEPHTAPQNFVAQGILVNLPAIPAQTSLIAAIAQPDHHLLQKLVKRAEQSRTWLLAPPDMTQIHLVDVKKAALGIRRMQRRLPSFLLHADGSRGWLEILGYWLELGVEQAQALRQEAIRLFWNEAEGEFNRHSSWELAPPVPAPFDVLGAPAKAPLHILLSADENHNLCEHLRIVHLVSPEPDTKLCFTPPGVFDSEYLALVQRKGRVVAVDQPLPKLALNELSGTIWLGQEGDWRIRLQLLPQQATDLTCFFTNLADSASAQLRLNIPLGEIAKYPVWLSERPGFEEVLDTLELDAGSFQAKSFAEMEQIKPSPWPGDDRPHLKRIISWEVRPPIAPPEAQKDPLVKAWEKLDKSFQKRVKTLRAQLNTVSQRRSIAQSLIDLANAWLGFGRNLQSLCERLNQIEDKVPSASGPEGAFELLQELKELEEKTERLSTDIQRKEHEARLAEERRKQEKEHEQAKEKAIKEMEVLNSKIEALDEKLKQALRDLVEVEEQPKPEGRRERKRYHKQLNAARNRHRAFDKDRQKLNQKLEELKELSQAPFEFKPPPEQHTWKPTADFVPKPYQTEEHIPVEALPKVGMLLLAGRERFLVIQRWDEAELGQEEAQRLQAKLVAKEVI